MERVLRRHNLQVSLPFGRTIAVAIVFLTVTVSIAELTLRQPAVQARLPLPSIGSSHRLFEIQVAQMDRLAAESSPVECVLLGSSQAYRGFDPGAFAAGYASVAGEPLTCYNFGLGGLTPATAEDVATLIIDRYDPALFIYTIEAFALDEDSEFNNAFDAIAQNVWVEYRNGEWSADGWLRDKSAAYRYYLLYRNWMQLGFNQMLADNREREAATTPLGQGPEPEVRHDVSRPPTEDERPNAYRTLASVEAGANHLAAVDAILAIGRTRPLVLVEMPLHPNFIPVAGNGMADFDAQMALLTQAADRFDVPFVTSTGRIDLPDPLWSDHNHLNATGAPVLSRWLGEQVASLVADGTLADPLRP